MIAGSRKNQPSGGKIRTEVMKERSTLMTVATQESANTPRLEGTIMRAMTEGGKVSDVLCQWEIAKQC